MNLKRTLHMTLFILIIAFSIYGYYDLIRQNGGITGFAVSDEIVEEQNIAPEVYFTTYENITPILIKFINNATDVRCSLYEVSEEQIVDALKEKNALVAVENNNYHDEFHTGNSSGEMHNKFCILDNNTVITGSTNLNTQGIYKNDNNLLIIHSEYIAKNYLQEFDEIYNDKFATGNKVTYPRVILNNNTMIQNYFCPEDECQTSVLNELSKADKSIIFMTFSFTDKKIADKLIEKNNAGLNVEGVFEKQRLNNQYEVYKYLNSSNVTITPDNNKYIMHHKVFIIDNETVITGSYNPTGNGNKNNDENIIIIKDSTIAKRYLEEYERLIT